MKTTSNFRFRIFLSLLIIMVFNTADAQKVKSSDSFIVEYRSKYAFDKTVEILSATAQERSWNIPVVHDLQKSLAKSGLEVRPVTVIEICKPEYSGKLLALDYERVISVFMPCRISVYEKNDGNTHVSVVNGDALAAGQPQKIAEVMKSASDEINDIVKKVTE